jgi:GTP cyclohydrolase I
MTLAQAPLLRPLPFDADVHPDPGAPLHGRRALQPGDRERLEGYAAAILSAAGLDIGTPSTRDTPRRFLDALLESTDGYEGDPKLLTTFPADFMDTASSALGQVVEGPIPFFALCEHHAMPFHGRAFVAYVPRERIIGISKLSRLVRVVTRRFGVQEQMTHRIAQDLDLIVDANGVAVYLEAHHLCTQMRGVREDLPLTRTTAYRGVYETDASLRSEFLEMSGIRRGDR